MGKRSELTPFGRQVKIRLLERGMDASELARRVGTSPVQISRILHGKRPGREQIPKIASELGIELDENGAPQQQAISIDNVSLCQDICEAALLYYRKNKEHFSFNYRIISTSDRLANLFGYDNEINI